MTSLKIIQYCLAAVRLTKMVHSMSSPIIKVVDRLNEEDRLQDICIIFSAIVSLLFNFYVALTSRKHAEKILSSAYVSVRQVYGDAPMFFYILRSLPDGVLEDEKSHYYLEKNWKLIFSKGQKN